MLAAGVLLAPAPAAAYIGPGAGFAVMSSFLVILVTMLAVAASILASISRLLEASVPDTGTEKEARRGVAAAKEGPESRELLGHCWQARLPREKPCSGSNYIV